MVVNKLLQLVFKKINLINKLPNYYRVGIPIEYTLEALWIELSTDYWHNVSLGIGNRFRISNWVFLSFVMTHVCQQASCG